MSNYDGRECSKCGSILHFISIGRLIVMSVKICSYIAIVLLPIYVCFNYIIVCLSCISI